MFSASVDLLRSILTSLRDTLSALAAAVRRRNSSDLAALIMEGSPLEGFVDNLLSAAFWILVLAPVLLVPIYYLAVSLA